MRIASLITKLVCLPLQASLKLPIQFTWKPGPYLPLALHCNNSPVVVQGKVYVGGGAAEWERDRYIIMEYDICSGKWATLPPYRTSLFAMAAVNNQVVLVGGRDHDGTSRMLGVWRADQKEWTHPYPYMNTARSKCSAAAYTDWLVVTGGVDNQWLPLSSVEVLNTETKQWHAGPPMPKPLQQMKTAVVRDVLYAMGGYLGHITGGQPTDQVYSVSFKDLIPYLNSKPEPEAQVWKEIPGLQLYKATPCSTKGSLLAVGGEDKNYKKVSAIHLYRPDTGEWVKIGDLPTPRSYCVCTMIADNKKMVVAGGWEGRAAYQGTKRMDIALLN